MRQWIPVSTSPKGRLALAAVSQFGARPFDAVAVADLAAAADVTTGALYHHFGSKLGLYSFVREDVERRVLDRMAGALAAGPGNLGAALRVGLEFAVAEGFHHLLAAPPTGERDRLAELLGGAVPGVPVLGPVLAAAWRAALAAVAAGAEPAAASAALGALTVA